MDNIAQIKPTLAWYMAMGVEEITQGTPTDWRKAVDAPTIQAAPVPSMPTALTTLSSNVRSAPAARTPASLSAATEEARDLANRATSLIELKQALLAFHGCTLRQTATHTVFAEGVPESGVMLIGEAPGKDEDLQGRPFCGVSGQLLDKMLAAIGLSRQQNCYITNCIFWRPPGNRTPTQEEIDICRPFVEKHIALVNPSMIILLGGVPSRALLETSESVSRLRGKNITYKNQYIDKEIPVKILYHPSYLLRQPLQKKNTWQDLLEIQQIIEEISRKASL